MKTIRQTVTAGNDFDGTAGNGLVDFVTGDQLLPLAADQLAVPVILNIELRLREAGAPPAAPDDIRCWLNPNDGTNNEERYTIFDTTLNADTVPAGFNYLGCHIPVPRQNDTGLPWLLQLYTTNLVPAACFLVSYTMDRV